MPLQRATYTPTQPQPCTISIASPVVITSTGLTGWGHGFLPGQAVVFFTTGSLPAHIPALTTLYVISTGWAATSFQVSLTPGGAAISTLGDTQSGTQSVVPVVNNLIGSGTVVKTTSVSSSLVVSAAPCDLIEAECSIGTVSGYLMIFDAASAPADGAGQTPIRAIPINSNGTWGYADRIWGPSPLPMLTGCTLVFSSAGPYTKTASATAHLMGRFQ